MRQDPNNEIDLLLRRLGRRHDAPASDGDLRVDADHLDADELSSYAENALPTAARARYTEHLAECTRCRELVVQLSSAAGVVVAVEPSRVPESSGLMKFLASLFSPMVMRYAIPAMGLAVVAVIGIGLFLSGERRGSIAGLTGSQAPVREQAPTPLSGMVDTQEKTGSPVATPEAHVNRSRAADPPAPSAAAAPVTVGEDAKGDTAPAEKKIEAQPVVTAAAPPPQPKPTTADEIRPAETEARREEAQGRTPATTVEQVNKDKAANQAKAEDNRAFTANRPAKRAAAIPAEGAGTGARAGAGTSAVQSADTSRNRDDDAETRSVAGRRFRKLRGIWVDTAYTDGATTNLTRGSEQYRGLVADEPGIKSIAEQLDGQIIVVWKGRAYRIQ